MCELKEALDNLPEGLEETYEKILEAIDERKSEGQRARRALAWLVVALEPLRLAQIVDGLSGDLLERKNDCETRSLGAALLDGLSSLVSHSEETDVLALSHFSVKVHSINFLHLYHLHVLLHRNTSPPVQHCQCIIWSPMRLTPSWQKCACSTSLAS